MKKVPNTHTFPGLLDSIVNRDVDAVLAFLAARPDFNWPAWPNVHLIEADNHLPKTDLARTSLKIGMHPVMVAIFRMENKSGTQAEARNQKLMAIVMALFHAGVWRRFALAERPGQ